MDHIIKSTRSPLQKLLSDSPDKKPLEKADDQVSCPQHLNYKINSICKVVTCNEPLCNECMIQHQQFHASNGTASDIQSISAIRAEALRFINDLINKYIQQDQQDYKQSIEKQLQLLKTAKYNVQQMIDEYFAYLEKQITTKKFNGPRNLCQIKEELESAYYIPSLLQVLETQHELENKNIGKEAIEKEIQVELLDHKIISLKKELLSYIHIKDGDYVVNQAIVQSEPKQGVDLQKLQEMDSYLTVDQIISGTEVPSLNPKVMPKISESPELNSNDSTFSQQKKLSVSTLKQSQQNQDYQRGLQTSLNQRQSNIVNRMNIIESKLQNLDLKVSGYNQQLFDPKQETNISTNSQVFPNTSQYFIKKNKIQELANVSVEGPETQPDNGILLYFQENSKKLYFYDVKEQSEKKSGLTDQNLKIEFRIPIGHRSIVTPDNEIFMIGGIYREQNPIKSSDNAFFMKLTDTTLAYHSKMNQGRAYFGICCMGGAIYVVGGQDNIDQGSTINYCEKLDLQSRKWSMIKPCIKRSSYCQLATFSKRFIFKFGGRIDILNHCNNIEYYDTKEDVWKEVNLKVEYPFLQIPSLCGVIQVNKNQIVIFGGLIHEAKSIDSYVLTVEKGDKGINETGFNIQRVSSLPKQSCFTSMPILRQNNIFVISDTIIEPDLSISFFNRKPGYQFNGTNWKEL